MVRPVSVIAMVLLGTSAHAQNLQDQQIWAKNSGHVWKSSQDGTDYGTAWRQPGFDTSGWIDDTFLHYTIHGAVPPDDRGYYFRTTFEVTDLYQVQSMQWEFYYDDAAVLFLNGNEVYRTIRNNLPTDPELPIHVNIPFGGAEDYYVQIPGENTCEQGCGTVQVPPIPVSELVEGTNVVGIMVWTRTNSDIGADVALTLTRDLDAPYPAPIVDPIPNQTSMLADAVSLQVVAVTENTPPMTYAATGLPPGLSIGAASGLITGAPTSMGSFSPVVTVTDDVGSTPVGFTWQINNAPPLVTNPGAQQTPVLNSDSVPVVASDPDGGPLSFSATGLPVGMNIHPVTGVMSGLSLIEGSNSVTVTVTDDEGDSVDVSFPWQIAEPPITINDPGAVSTPYGVPFSLVLSAVDPLGTVDLAVSGLPPGFTFDPATDTISGTPTTIGESTVLIDGSGPSGEAVISFPWTVPNELAVVTVPAGTPVGLESYSVDPVTVSAVDPDGGDVTLAVSGLPAGMSFDATMGTIGGTPSESGTFTVVVTATDDEGDPASASFPWNISPEVDKVIVINEIMASNDFGLLDEDGDTSDWIELYNPTPIAFDLEGWVLQDVAAQWVLPDITLPPGGYQLIFASAKDRAVPTEELHTNFRLARLGDRVLLADDAGFVIDDVGGPEMWPQQVTDNAYGVSSGGAFGYLDTPTPEMPNSELAQGLDPEMSPFSDRLFNVGDVVNLSISLFDPDEDSMTFDMLPAVPGVSFDQAGGITGVADTAGIFPTTFELTDSDGDFALQDVEFRVYETPTRPPGLILNEYNAVPPVSELLGGSDPAFVEPFGNGGDWYEFVVVEEGLDLRGWTIELWDRDTPDGLIVHSATLTFEMAPELASLPAGTLVTISEDWADDLSLDPANGDYSINLQSNDALAGQFISLATQESFNSSRSEQNVLIFDAMGTLASPLVGETEGWDLVNGGVGEGEVLSLCTDPSTAHVDPVADYRDNGFFSSWGLPNTCVDLGDPLDPDDDITWTQDFSGVRDLDGDGVVDGDDLCPDDPGNDPDGDGVCAADDICPDGPDDVDTDADGVPDACDLCPIDNPNDTDADGVCESEDICPGSDDTIDTDADGIPNGCDDCLSLDDTDGDGQVDDCDACPIDPLDDSDGDGSCDSTDTCPGEDDRIDTDNDLLPDGCDPCPEDPFDADGDGVCDSLDICEGFDDTVDGDGDGVPDGCDACPMDATDDSDGDGVCDGVDICPGEPDGQDADSDGVPDGCDACPEDSENDADGDGVCGGEDVCPSGDDTLDADGDGLPDACDPCPDVVGDECEPVDTDTDTDDPDTDTDVPDTEDPTQCFEDDCIRVKRCGCSTPPTGGIGLGFIALAVFGLRRRR